MLFDKRGLIPQIEPRYRYPYFSHIFTAAIRPDTALLYVGRGAGQDVFEAFARAATS